MDGKRKSGKRGDKKKQLLILCKEIEINDEGNVWWTHLS
jgi:hypothetical protein